MKFWQKAFIGILIVFIIAINICLFLTSKYSFTLNMKRDTERALGEYHFIINGVYDAMNSIYYREETMPTPASMESLMRTYADYYKTQNVYFELRHANQLLFSNLPSEAQAQLKNGSLNKNTYAISTLAASETNYLYISGKVAGQYENYKLTYLRDLSELYDTHRQLTSYLVLVSASVEFILAVVLLVLLRRLTYPIGVIQTAAGKIAKGVYDERIIIPGKDEFHDLANHFNQMADSIQEKITELDKNAQDKQRLVDNLAHELRTPLTAIKGYAEYLQNANASEENRIKATGYIVKETDRMRDLAFKLLDLALIRNSKLDLQQIAPIEMLSQVRDVLAVPLKEKDIHLDIHSSLDFLIGDPVLLKSLLVNLIDNGIKASTERSSIQLTASFDQHPILEVKDWGCGMLEEETALACKPFYRVDKARSRNSGGIGLGLSLCHEIAHLHSAELKITSKPGQGTTVQVVFTTSLQPRENSVMNEGI